MRKSLLLILLIFFSFSLFAQNRPFVTTWQVTEDDLTITIPTIGTGYAYTVDWGDNSHDQTIYNGDAVHVYAAPKIAYTISISGTFPRIYFYNADDKENILSVEQWGSNPWTSMEFAFDGCSNLIVKADDVPDLTNVTSMRFLFRGATNFNQDISHWDVSNVTNMRNMFDRATAFNQPLNSWDVSNVTDMQSMFSHASSFNQPLSNWVTTKVLLMNGMFSGASAFNQDISTNQDTNESDKKWDVSNVTNMSAMFFRASSFNQDIGNWNVSSVTNMNSLFNSTAFNQDISSWNVGNVTTMSQMFNAAVLFNQDISDWDVSKVTNMASMFRFVTLSTENYDALLNGWSTQTLQNGVDFSGGNSLYCEGATARQSLIDNIGWAITDGGVDPNCFKPFVTTWRTDNPGTSNSTSITIPTSGGGYSYDIDWDDDGIYDEFALTGDVTHDYGTAGTYTVAIRGDFPRIFFNGSGDKDKILTVGQWGSNSWTSMENAFEGCANLDVKTQDVPDLSKVTSLQSMFEDCTSLVGDSAMNTWNTSSITRMDRMFFNASSFNQDIGIWDTSSAVVMSQMFSGASTFNQDIGGWNTEKAENMFAMFNEATAFNQDIGRWRVDLVTNMNAMFFRARSFNQDIGGWKVGQVRSMELMFLEATSFNQSLDLWDVSRVRNMSSMFLGARTFNGAIGNWKVSAVQEMVNMFSGATAFNQDIGNWDVGSVTQMLQMFQNATAFNQDIGNWDVSLVIDVRQMFKGASSFDQNLGNWDISSMKLMGDMFNNVSGLSIENYDNTLIGWVNLAVGESQIPINIEFNGGTSQYCVAKEARDLLTKPIETDDPGYGWIITDMGNACPDTEAPKITCLEAKTEYVDNNCATSIILGNPTATDDVSITFIFNGIRSDDAELDAPFDVGITTITWTATDEAGRVSDECEQIITVIDNIPPTGTAPEDIAGLQSISEVPVADIASILDVNDNCEGEITVSVVDSNNGGSGCKDDPYIVTRTFTLTDINGLTTDLIQFITVEDDKAPIITNIDTPEEPIQIGFDFQLSASFEGNDIKNATWYLSSNGVDYDYSIVGELEGNRINFNNTLAQIPAGVYSIELKVEDTCENYSKLHADVFLVIFDPDGGHVTGGGFIDSPAQALVGSNQQGTANFGFSAKYKKGNNQVDGNTNFQFKAGDFHFKSSYNNDMSLVISGNKKATYKGVGAINGTGEYKFMVSVIDGDAQGGDGDDKFRIKIWEVNSDDEKIVIYDNEVDKSDNADALTPITKGSIVIHNEKVNSNALKVNLPLDLVIQDGEKDDFQVLQWPNPTTDSFTISVETNNLENAKIQVFDFNGKLIINNEFNPYEGYRFGDDLEAGLYIVKIIQAKKETTLKLVKK